MFGDRILELHHYTPEPIDCKEKDFPYLEETLSSHCFTIPPYTCAAFEEDAETIGHKITERRNKIINFFNENAKKLKLNQLSLYDMYAVAQGIIDRAHQEDRQKLEKVILTESEVQTKGFDILFNAVVNRGIGDKWIIGCKKGADGKEEEINLLHGLKIVLPSPKFETEYNKIYITAAAKEGIIFEF